MNKNFKRCLMVVAPFICALASCSAGGTVVEHVASKDYAGYSADLNVDGSISDNEKGLTWAQSYDYLYSQSGAQSDANVRYKYLHAAEDLLMSTGCITPLYYYTDIYMKNAKLNGFYANSLGYKYFYGCDLDGKSEFTVCEASEPQTIDPALNSSVDGAVLLVNSFSGLVKYQMNAAGTGVELAADVASEMPTYVESADGKSVTVTVKLRDGLKWSDGTSYDANAFIYAWNRAASAETASDYGYMFDCIDGYEDVSAGKSGAKLNATASSDGKTITIVLNNPTAKYYFNQLLAFPTYFPVKEGVVDKDGKWATSPDTYISNGPMKLSSWTHNSSLVYEKNPYYFNTAACKATKITYALSDDDASILTNYLNGEYHFIDSLPNEQQDKMKAEHPSEYFVVGQIGTYYTSWNINSKVFDKVCDTEEKREKTRNALSLLIDRNYIVDEIGKAGQIPANGFVAKGITEANGTTEWVDANGKNRDGKGYYSVDKADLSSNRTSAIETLKEVGFTYDESSKKFTNFPSVTYILNNSSGHKLIGEYIQNTFSLYGISMKLESMEWADFLTARKAGDYDYARNGWLADYNDPTTFLGMWTSNSGNNDCQFGK